MSRQIWSFYTILSLGWIAAASGENFSKLNLNIGGGPSTPLNPTGQFAKGTSAGGVNASAGFTISFGDTNWTFYLEGRYHYAWNYFVPSTLVPVTFGIRYR
jgi:hypothetical protein